MLVCSMMNSTSRPLRNVDSREGIACPTCMSLYAYRRNVVWNLVTDSTHDMRVNCVTVTSISLDDKSMHLTGTASQNEISS